jgi:hypothetical protein
LHPSHHPNPPIAGSAYQPGGGAGIQLAAARTLLRVAKSQMSAPINPARITMRIQTGFDGRGLTELASDANRVDTARRIRTDQMANVAATNFAIAERVRYPVTTTLRTRVSSYVT